MPYPETTTGFAVTDTNQWSTFTKKELKLKPFEDYDIDVAISCSGVCGSDVHTITGGWGDVSENLPLIVGHEIVGRAVKVGSKVTTIKVGDRVGIGAQVGADLDCKNCKSGYENYCPNGIDTYGSKYPDGTISQGGYASHARAHEVFTFKIPDNISDEVAAPMLCAGITTYGPLVELGCGEGKKVAIVGLGGLGHFAVMWAVALGADVTVLSHSPTKKDDALKMGANHFVSTKDKDWAKPLAMQYDFILSTADVMKDMELTDYFSILKPFGRYHNVGMPDHDLTINMQMFAANGVYIGTSHLGNRKQMESMLKLASEKNLKTWVQTIPISEAGCKEAVERVKNSDNIRYRLTLTDYDAVFGKRY